jgi:hypothetical protein
MAKTLFAKFNVLKNWEKYLWILNNLRIIINKKMDVELG